MQQLKDRICQVRDAVQKNLYSICFCENPLNETLWLKYGDNHRGFVLVYDFYDDATRLCGFEEKCKNCGITLNPPNIYPIYYCDKRYDATRYALSLLLSNALNITPYFTGTFSSNAAINDMGDRANFLNKEIQTSLRWRVENDFAHPIQFPTMYKVETPKDNYWTADTRI